jgi:AcrR family transcriptional regulator
LFEKMRTPESSELPTPPWQRHPPERTRRRGRDPITREAIVETALRLLDRDGLDELSMRRVADELDTGPASLYWHVGSKDGLLELVFDRVIGEVEMPSPEPARWEEQLKEVARAGRAMILRHRDIVRISIGRVPMGPNALRVSEGLFAILRAGGVPDQLAVTAHHLLFAQTWASWSRARWTSRRQTPHETTSLHSPPTSSPTSSPSPSISATQTAIEASTC